MFWHLNSLILYSQRATSPSSPLLHRPFCSLFSHFDFRSTFSMLCAIFRSLLDSSRKSNLLEICDAFRSCEFDFSYKAALLRLVLYDLFWKESILWEIDFRSGLTASFLSCPSSVLFLSEISREAFLDFFEAFVVVEALSIFSASLSTFDMTTRHFAFPTHFRRVDDDFWTGGVNNMENKMENKTFLAKGHSHIRLGGGGGKVDICISHSFTRNIRTDDQVISRDLSRMKTQRRKEWHITQVWLDHKSLMGLFAQNGTVCSLHLKRRQIGRTKKEKCMGEKKQKQDPPSHGKKVNTRMN